MSNLNVRHTSQPERDAIVLELNKRPLWKERVRPATPQLWGAFNYRSGFVTSGELSWPWLLTAGSVGRRKH